MNILAIILAFLIHFNGEYAMTLQLRSPAYEAGGMIPAKYTCDGENISPPLHWSEVPEQTKTFALIFDDPDAPGKTWVHWVIYNMPADQRGLDEKVPGTQELDDGVLQGINDFRKTGYGGPCPPSGTHRYYMKLYALDSKLDLTAGATKEELLKAMHGHIIEQAELIGRYERK